MPVGARIECVKFSTGAASEARGRRARPDHCVF